MVHAQLRVGDFEVPEGLYFTKEHEWARVEDESHASVGITDYATNLLHEIVYVDLPKKGAEAKQMEAFGTVESVKAASELFSPLSGTVIEVNAILETRPELVNKSPYGEGWLIKLEPRNLNEELGSLMDSEAYASLLAKLK